MSEQKYSKAPWRATRETECFAPLTIVSDANDNLVAGDVPLSTDGNLIAAAPELLAALAFYANLDNHINLVTVKDGKYKGLTGTAMTIDRGEIAHSAILKAESGE